jgi:hypothetical protein
MTGQLTGWGMLHVFFFSDENMIYKIRNRYNFVNHTFKVNLIATRPC